MASPRNSVVDVDAAAAAASPPADAGGDGMLCQYPSKKCQGVRVRKRDGGLHRFCDYHRSIANRNQRRADRRRRHKKEVKMITPFRRPIPPQQPPMLLPSMVAFHHHHGYSAEVMPRMDASAWSRQPMPITSYSGCSPTLISSTSFRPLNPPMAQAHLHPTNMPSRSDTADFWSEACSPPGVSPSSSSSSSSSSPPSSPWTIVL